MTERSRFTGSGPAARIRVDRVPKPGGGVRRIARLDPMDERGFASAVRPMAALVARSRSAASHADRYRAWGPRGPILEPWRPARARWSREARRLAREAGVVITSDVLECYQSVSPEALEARLRSLGADRDSIEALRPWFRAFEAAGISGLPIGPSPSAPLGEAMLQIGDEALRLHRVAFLRWVDDVVIFAPERSQALQALGVLEDAWALAGLAANRSKTASFDDPMAWAGSGRHAVSPGSSSLR